MSSPSEANRRRPAGVLLFDQNPQAMWVSDQKSGRFLDVNQAAVYLYGYSREEFLRMSVDDVRVIPEEPIPQDRLIPAHPQVSVGQFRHRLKRGGTIDVEVAERVVRYQGRAAVIAVLSDMTHRRQLEAQLRQAQRMEAVGMLAGGVAHDFNNLLTIMSGYSQMLLNGLPPNDANRLAAEQIVKASDRAAALTRQLLTFSRRQAFQPKVLDLNVLVTGLSVMLHRVIGEDIDLRLDLAPNLGQVSADPGQIEQVIMNLVVNSRDAMPDGGTLTLQTRDADLDESYTGTHISVKPGPYVSLAVIDTGIGMDEETRSHVFEPFFTTKERGKGTGLGLSTVFGIMKQSGGNLEVRSRVGEGASFRIYLPRIERAEISDSLAHDVKTPRGSETILLVEDEEMVRTLVRETLQLAGYKLLDASEGARAEQISASYKGPIHLLITDIVMPKLNGQELAERLKGKRPDMKVLFMSGYTDRAFSGCASPQDRQFLQKPFTPASLARKVREVLESNGGRTRRAGDGN